MTGTQKIPGLLRLGEADGRNNIVVCLSLSHPFSRGAIVPKHPWQVSGSRPGKYCRWCARFQHLARHLGPVDACTPGPVTVALPQRIFTAFPFHLTRSQSRSSPDTGDALFSCTEGYVAGPVQSNAIQTLLTGCRRCPAITTRPRMQVLPPHRRQQLSQSLP